MDDQVKGFSQFDNSNLYLGDVYLILVFEFDVQIFNQVQNLDECIKQISLDTCP
jgi:hypothetical protein